MTASGSPLRCIWHDPDRQAEAVAARQRGKEAVSANARKRRLVRTEDPTPPLEASLSGVVARMTWVVQQASAGRIEPKTLTAMVYALSNLRVSIEKMDLDGKLAEARAELKKLRRKVNR